jgi:hypothetical protein
MNFALTKTKTDWDHLNMAKNEKKLNSDTSSGKF